MKYDKLLPLILLLISLKSTLSQAPPFVSECVSGAYPPKVKEKVPEYTINLDLPPSERWTHVVKEKAAEIKNLIQTFKDFILNFGGTGQAIISLVDNDLGYLADTMPAPFNDELKGIANATGLPLGEIVLYNIFYEVFTVCTSVVAEDPKGNLYHARNLDFGLFMGWDPRNHTWSVTTALRPMIANLDFQRGGKTAYRSVQYVGYVGIITGMKPGVFTLTMNERFNIDGGFMGVIEWILGARKGVFWTNFLTRDVLDRATSFSEARDRLANTTILAPAYFIVGGNSSGQGSIITRSRQGAVDVWDLGTRNSSWYLLETNYDHWKDPLFLDDRRTPANNCMRKMTQKNVGFSGIFNVLSSVPVLNKLTTYTALMQVNSGKLETYLQYCDDDSKCSPW